MAERTNINEDEIGELIRLARDAQNNAYAPYSGFRVGSAILSKSGKVYTGCNVENASFGLTVCAERTALFQGVSQGEREFVAVVITSDSKVPCAPCGACRQVLAEFGPEMQVIIVDSKGNYQIIALDTLLPMAFTENNLA